MPIRVPGRNELRSAPTTTTVEFGVAVCRVRVDGTRRRDDWVATPAGSPIPLAGRGVQVLQIRSKSGPRYRLQQGNKREDAFGRPDPVRCV